MTYGEAVQDTTTKLGADAAKCAAEQRERIAAAREIATREGISLEDALLRYWIVAVAQ